MYQTLFVLQVCLVMSITVAQLAKLSDYYGFDLDEARQYIGLGPAKRRGRPASDSSPQKKNSCHHDYQPHQNSNPPSISHSPETFCCSLKLYVLGPTFVNNRCRIPQQPPRLLHSLLDGLLGLARIVCLYRGVA